MSSGFSSGRCSNGESSGTQSGEPQSISMRTSSIWRIYASGVVWEERAAPDKGVKVIMAAKHTRLFICKTKTATYVCSYPNSVFRVITISRWMDSDLFKFLTSAIYSLKFKSVFRLSISWRLTPYPNPTLVLLLCCRSPPRNLLKLYNRLIRIVPSVGGAFAVIPPMAYSGKLRNTH